MTRHQRPVAFGEGAATRYPLLQVIGNEAMGEVLVAREGALARAVAFERMAPEWRRTRA